MSGDYSRMSFDPVRDFCGVLMQQGRVQLDSDWNEWVAIVERRLRAGTMDTIGRAVVPRETADAFRVQAVGGAVRILPGRMYVDGIVVENHGSGAPAWDEHLAELRRPDGIDYLAQPYLPNAPALPAGGPHVVYIDVWQREVTPLMQPDLVEKALGVDTTTRQQNVWQVKLWPNVPNDVTCATPLADLEKWTAVNGPSTARLTTSTMHGGNDDDPCLAPPTAGYTGLENQFYRIEIHTPGGAGAARFKWSRDNGSVATRVLSITGNTRLVVESVGKDGLLRFSDGDWVEITDDWRELNGLPGEVRRIRIGGGVDDATRTIVLDTALPGGAFPVDGQGNTQPGRHTRIQRWDQKGKILKADGTVFIDLDAPGADGLIPVPPAGTQLQIEQGVLVEFSGTSRRLDYWTFAARAIDASVEKLDAAPPRGIHHHYAKLAIITLPDDETDCRTLWPPVSDGGDCACSVCVHADDHNSGKATIQQAIDSIAKTGGTVCLEPGTYRINEPITLANVTGIRVRGQGIVTVLVGGGERGLFRVRGARSCAIEDLAMAGVALERGGMVGIANVADLALRRLYAIALRAGDNAGTVLGLSGVALGLIVDESILFGDRVMSIDETEAKFFFGAELRIDDNLMIARTRGIDFHGQSLFAQRLRISGNTVIGCRDAGIVVSGAALPGCNTRVQENTVDATGSGIVVGVSDATVAGNVCASQRGDLGDGIRAEPGLVPSGLRRLQIVNNRVLAAHEVGIRLAAAIHGGIIKQNQIDGAGIAGISVEAGSASEVLSIENNHITDVATKVDGEGEVYGGIRVVRAASVDIRGNQIARVARNAARARSVAGIVVMSADELAVCGNVISGIGALDGFLNLADGIVVLGPDLNAEVGGNRVQRRDGSDSKMGEGRWSGIRLPLADETGVNFGTKVHGVVASKALAVAFLGDRVLEAVRAVRNVTVSGNRVQGQDSRQPYVWIEQTRSAIVSQNQVEVAPNGSAIEPLVQLRIGAFTVNANVVRSSGDFIAMQIDGSKTSLPIGNLTTGAILVNGLSPSPPFNVLNTIIS